LFLLSGEKAFIKILALGVSVEKIAVIAGDFVKRTEDKTIS